MIFKFKRTFEEARPKLDQDPDRQRVEVRTESRQVDGLRSVVRVRDFTVTVDQPASLGGVRMAVTSFARDDGNRVVQHLEEVKSGGVAGLSVQSTQPGW